jgi:ferredoxin-NADP reductase
VLSRPTESWTGERGRIDLDVIRRHVSPLAPGKTFYVCGPPAMMTATIADLIRAGVSESRIRAERFDL